MLESKDSLLTFTHRENKKKADVISVRRARSKEQLSKFSVEMTSPHEYADWDVLTDQEKLEFSLYLANLSYVKNKLGLAKEPLIRTRLVLPQALYEGMIAYQRLCDQYKIDLNPFEGMLNGLINSCKNIESHIKKHDNSVNILPNIGISLKDQRQAQRKRYKKEIQLIIEKALSMAKFESLIAEVVKQYNKDSPPSTRILHMAAKGKNSPSPWVVSAIIYLLMEYQPAMLKNINHETIKELWRYPFLKNTGLPEEVANKAFEKFRNTIKK